MKRFSILALLAAACSQQPAEPVLSTGTFAGAGHNRLCLAGQPGSYRGGVIVYASGDSNCSASGRIEKQGDQLMLIPSGEGPCRIPLALEGDTVRIGEVPAACSYYCGPEADLSGKAFMRSVNTTAATDLAGDPLC